MFRFSALKASTVGDIKLTVKEHLASEYLDLLPEGRDASILIKPNLNSNMTALTGNTTDLRLLAAVVEFLKDRGYRGIAIGEGTNSGFYRNRISVIDRLRVRRLAEHYGLSVIDLNYSEPVMIDFEDGVKAGVAREVLEADFLINMPKLKTHFEVGMSVCLKNLMGCLVGQENKKKTHHSLSANILNINRAVKPHLHIVDALFCMEGLGPTRGTPLKTETIFVGTDPYLIDLISARFAGFDWKNIRTLAEAGKRGIINTDYHRFTGEFPLEMTYHFAPPKAGPLATFIHSPKRQKYFLAIRNTPLFEYLCSTKLVGKLLFLTGLRQDVFIDEEAGSEALVLNESLCRECRKCAEYCPLGLDLPGGLPDQLDDCLACLYCFSVCPNRAIEHVGDFGFLAEQIRQYDEILRKIS